MSGTVKTRRYDSSRRRAAARRTRRGILEAAVHRFVADGYAATTMAVIAADAGVAVDTIYSAIGTKAQVFRLLVESALSGEDEPVPALERDYVQSMREADGARAKLTVYARAVREIHVRLGPLFGVLRHAAEMDDELAALWSEIAQRRAENMRLLAADLAGTGELRTDLAVDDVADIVWATNSSELYDLLVRGRGWSPERFEAFLLDAWCRILLEG